MILFSTLNLNTRKKHVIEINSNYQVLGLGSILVPGTGVFTELHQ